MNTCGVCILEIRVVKQNFEKSRDQTTRRLERRTLRKSLDLAPLIDNLFLSKNTHL